LVVFVVRIWKLETGMEIPGDGTYVTDVSRPTNDRQKENGESGRWRVFDGK